MGYWIPVGNGHRVFESNLKDAYLTAAKVLIGKYRSTKGQIHKEIPEYSGSYGIPIYDSATGKGTSHWVRFDNGSNPKDGYEECSYSKNTGMNTKSKSFPKNW